MQCQLEQAIDTIAFTLMNQSVITERGYPHHYAHDYLRLSIPGVCRTSALVALRQPTNAKAAALLFILASRPLAVLSLVTIESQIVLQCQLRIAPIITHLRSQPQPPVLSNRWR